MFHNNEYQDYIIKNNIELQAKVVSLTAENRGLADKIESLEEELDTYDTKLRHTKMYLQNFHSANIIYRTMFHNYETVSHEHRRKIFIAAVFSILMSLVILVSPSLILTLASLFSVNILQAIVHFIAFNKRVEFTNSKLKKDISDLRRTLDIIGTFIDNL